MQMTDSQVNGGAKEWTEGGLKTDDFMQPVKPLSPEVLSQSIA